MHFQIFKKDKCFVLVSITYVDLLHHLPLVDYDLMILDLIFVINLRDKPEILVILNAWNMHVGSYFYLNKIWKPKEKTINTFWKNSKGTRCGGSHL